MTGLLLAMLLMSRGISISFDPVSPYHGALGLACAPEFRSVPGNAQERCHGVEYGIVLYAAALVDDQHLKHALYHENKHLEAGADGPPSDPFNERARYFESCSAYPVPECSEWLAALR